MPISKKKPTKPARKTASKRSAKTFHGPDLTHEQIVVVTPASDPLSEALARGDTVQLGTVKPGAKILPDDLIITQHLTDGQHILNALEDGLVPGNVRWATATELQAARVDVHRALLHVRSLLRKSPMTLAKPSPLYTVTKPAG